MAIGTLTPDFTIEVAFTIDNATLDMHLLAKSDSGTPDWRIFLDPINTNALRFQIYQTDNVLREMVIANLDLAGVTANGAWHYSSIEMDYSAGALLSWYIDNTLRAQVSVADWSGQWRDVFASRLCWGNDFIGGAKPWGGKVDELSIYSKILTAAERDENYNWWAYNAAGTIYGDVTTVQFNTEFELPSLVNSYLGEQKLRQNFRTADPAYEGLTGDYAAGVPAPVVAPSVVVENEGLPTDVDTDTRFYVMTYVNRLGYESAPGPVTDTPSYVGVDSTVFIGFPKTSDIAYHPSVYGKNILQDYIPIVSARFYRTNTGSSETGFQFIAEKALINFDLTFSDIDNDELGELLITDGWDVPPPEVTSGCKMANGTYVLVHDQRVHFSVPGVTYAFPILYNRVIKYKALHVEAVGTSAVLLTSGGPHLISGGSPDVIEVVELPYNQVPTSARAVSVYMDLVIFPAQDGLTGVDSNGRVINLTEDLFEEDQWREEIPLTDLISEVHDSTYYAFYNGVTAGVIGFSFNLKTKQWVWLDNRIVGTTPGDGSVSGMYYDRSSDSLYICENAANQLSEWSPHGNFREALSVPQPAYATNPNIISGYNVYNGIKDWGYAQYGAESDDQIYNVGQKQTEFSLANYGNIWTSESVRGGSVTGDTRRDTAWVFSRLPRRWGAGGKFVLSYTFGSTETYPSIDMNFHRSPRLFNGSGVSSATLIRLGTNTFPGNSQPYILGVYVGSGTDSRFPQPSVGSTVHWFINMDDEEAYMVTDNTIGDVIDLTATGASSWISAGASTGSDNNAWVTADFDPDLTGVTLPPGTVASDWFGWNDRYDFETRYNLTYIDLTAAAWTRIVAGSPSNLKTNSAEGYLEFTGEIESPAYAVSNTVYLVHYEIPHYADRADSNPIHLEVWQGGAMLATNEDQAGQAKDDAYDTNGGVNTGTLVFTPQAGTITFRVAHEFNEKTYIDGMYLLSTTGATPISKALWTDITGDFYLPAEGAGDSNPTPWEWVTKEFIVPQRSYGVVKVMGELSGYDRIQVVLEVDGVDQPVFPLEAGLADGELGSEKPFRLPAVRAQRMRLKLTTASGAPKVESVQIAVHPKELV